ncbi:dicarboxylate/amino acid:cation symporter [Sphingomonas sp. LY29]|uniref:dicarboxylate/amino acid:cation symporter n=1 Tax=unclassified Sphingomonas TaxID=196159 RepID=UPI002ADEBD6B|nr:MULTISPECIES: dicarboxylate/amino acid:cation symporter [unclassified Sphingomonas]MEA1071311.1 dicarboxylate/amino acid:cation symporter [Sphingomonas sp. LY160]WRP26005.1 dicarboxylate/amino acid:cation symporter [Sphingomonas sp. LY29]
MTKTERKGIALQWQMLIGFLVGLIAGLIANAAGGGDAPWVDAITTYVTGPIGQIFLRLLFMLVIPLLFSALVVGIAEMGDVRSLKRVGLKTLFFTVAVSGIAVVMALFFTNLIQPGAGVDQALAAQLLADAREGAGAILSGQSEKPQGVNAVLAIIPNNVVAAAADNDILAVMFFALIFGIGLLITDSRPAQALQSAIEGIFHVAMTLISIIIKFAPIAIACFMFNLSAVFGWELLLRLGAYVGVVLLALGTQMFVVYPLVIKFAGKMSPLFFFRQSQEAMVMAFSTASSNATLPTALRVAETKLNLPPRVARFVLTIGATANQNGTAIFEGVTVLFLAQFFGVELSLAQQALVLLVCILGGIGTAGVPAGSLPVVALILGMIGVPPEGIGLVLGVDRFLDMCRTTLNVTGDLACATVVSRGEEDVPATIATAPESAAAI